jgi:hypothetical protein
MAEVLGTLAGTITADQRKATDVASARRKPQYIAPKTFRVSANLFPLTQLIDKLGVKKDVGHAAYNHLENDEHPNTVTDDGSGMTNNATTFDVATGHGKRVKVGSILKVLRTGEMMRVTAISTDALTVSRAVGSATPGTGFAVNASEPVSILSHADTDGNTAPRSITTEPNIKTNYTQIFRTAVEMSGRDLESDNFGEDEWQRCWDDAMRRHLREIEQAMLFQNGTLANQSASEPNITTGLEGYISTNVTANLGADMSEAGWNDVLRRWLRRNQTSDEGALCFFVGELLNKAITGYGRDQLRYSPNDKVFGIACKKYLAETGQVITLVRHPLFSPLGSDETASNYGWQGHGMGLNMNLIGFANFKNRIKKIQKDIETPGTDGTKQAILDDKGLWLASERQHCLVTGVGG